MNEIDELIKQIFGEYADQALVVLAKENARRETGKEVDKTNEGYDAGNNPFHAPSKTKIAEGDVLGDDGLWHSIDRGLMRVNSRTFFDFLKRKPELLAANGISSYEDMLDPVKSVIFARILFNEQGWRAWAAAPKELKAIKPNEPVLGNISKPITDIVPYSPTPTPSPMIVPTRAPIQEYQPRPTRLLSPLSGQEYAPTLRTRVTEGLKKAGEFVDEKVTEGLKDLFGTATYEFGPVSQKFGARNPGEIYSGGVNYGTDFAIAKGTPVNLPQGNWKVLETFSGATAEGPNNRQRGINRGYGNSILVQNLDTGEKLRFSHLSSVGVRPGQTINGGQIGKSGATGNVLGKTGAHLDVEYYDPSGKIADLASSSLVRKQPGAVQTVATNLSKNIVKPAYAAEEYRATPTKAYSPTAPAKTPTTNYSPTKPIMSTQMSVAPTQRMSVAPMSTPARNYAPSNSFTVQRGNTLSGIAAKNNTTVARLLQMNPQIKNPNMIYAGSSLRLG